jgi:hypothetical protein
MILRTVYIVDGLSRERDEVEVPLPMTIDDGMTARLDEVDDEFRLTMDRRVDASKLEVVTESGWWREHEDGTREPLPRLRLRDDVHEEVVGADDVVSALSFIVGRALTFRSSRFDHVFIADSDADRRKLEDLGADQPFIETFVQFGTRTFVAPVSAQNVQAVLQRRVGVRLFADAVGLSLGVAQFRELWRILESAFGKTDSDLVALLAAYQPAQAMKFTEAELQELLVLRGRASHAQSKAGLRELAAVESECSERLGRLRNLAERVILTKKSWGYPTTGVEELARMDAYIGPNGEQVYRASRPSD